MAFFWLGPKSSKAIPEQILQNGGFCETAPRVCFTTDLPHHGFASPRICLTTDEAPAEFSQTARSAMPREARLDPAEGRIRAKPGIPSLARAAKESKDAFKREANKHPQTQLPRVGGIAAQPFVDF